MAMDSSSIHQNFLKWLREKGFMWDDKQLDLQRHKVCAVKTLRSGETVCTLPKDALLTVRTSSVAKLLNVVGLTYGHYPGTERGAVGLAVALMRERSLGAISEWAPYLATLPKLEPLPVCWGFELTGDEYVAARRVLRGTDLEWNFENGREQMREDFELYVKPLTDQRPDLFPQNEHFSFEAYVAARTLLASRAFRLDSYHGEGLVPLADLFNHDTCEEVHFTGEADVCQCCGLEKDEDEEQDDMQDEFKDVPDRPKDGPCPLCKQNVGKQLADDYKVFSMIMCRDVQVGREVFNTYGVKGNRELLASHAFTLFANPFAKVCITPLQVAAAHQQCGSSEIDLEGRLQLALSIGLLVQKVPEDEQLQGKKLTDTLETMEPFELCRDNKDMEMEEEEEGEQGEQDEEPFCPFPKELLLFANLICADNDTIETAKRVVQELECGGEAQVPVLDQDALNAGQLEGQLEMMDDVEEVLWQIFANAALRWGYLQGPPAASFAFLLRAKGVQRLLEQTLLEREKCYSLGDNETLEADEARLVELRPQSASIIKSSENSNSDKVPVSPPLAEMALGIATHALQLRYSERLVLAAAHEALRVHYTPVPEPQSDKTATETETAGETETDTSTIGKHHPGDDNKGEEIVCAQQPAKRQRTDL